MKLERMMAESAAGLSHQSSLLRRANSLQAPTNFDRKFGVSI
jgi:hypothetical protein